MKGIRIFCHITVLVTVIIFLMTDTTFAQTGCTVPESPVLKIVSVNPESGNVTLKWDLSPSTGIAAYIVYSYNDGVGIPVDTVWDSSASEYEHITTATRYFSAEYVVAAHRKPDCTSPLSNPLETIHAKAVTDTCNRKIHISWNKYKSGPLEVTGYSISASRENGPFIQIAGLSKDSTEMEFKNFITDSEYSFIVKAILVNGDSSLSNKAITSTKMQRPPDWINADYASVKDNKIELSFTADPFSETIDYLLERETGRTGIFNEIERLVSATGKIIYTDENADVSTINSYRLSAINSCNIPVTISNPASNIVLSNEVINGNYHLVWNRYEKWNGETDSYTVMINTGGGFREIASSAAEDTSYVIDYKDIMYDVTSEEICITVLAREKSNPYGINGSSLSEEVCAGPEEVITIPDVFTPNNDLINDLFKPVLSFIPVEYFFSINSRTGKLIFETRNHDDSWDGTERGKRTDQGVYLWNLRLKTPSGKVISRTGIVTLYLNR